MRHMMNSRSRLPIAIGALITFALAPLTARAQLPGEPTATPATRK